MSHIVEDFESCYRLSCSRDPRYDGIFFIAVTSTRLYCRPSCPARIAKRSNVCFYPTAAAAQSAGFRACKRCRPDASPGSPDWNWRADRVGRAMRLIGDGTVDREGVSGLAKRLGFSDRHLRRLLSEEVGASPVALARAQRANTARLLIESTAMSFADAALAAGFHSVRQFNATIKDVFDLTPGEMRHRSDRACSRSPGVVELRLNCREPFDAAALLRFLEVRAVPGLEDVSGGTYRRALTLAHGIGIVELTPEVRSVRCVLLLDDFRDLAAAVARCRRLLDLDADPLAIAGALGRDKVIGGLVRARPGLRVPGCVDGDELALRAVLGQRASLRAARTQTACLVETFGAPLRQPLGTVTRLFPSAAVLAEADPSAFAGLGLRRAPLQTLAAQLTNGEVRVDAGSDPIEALTRLLAIRGIGPWTAAYVAMRGFHDPDAFPNGDAGLRRALEVLGCPVDPRSVAKLQQRWRPWRAYAVVQLWTSLDH
ncbi:DNA-3-methyladenine glycosylase II [Kribbella steppae]|uniref:DNA-3-methyladenine glycosylase II n=1 Tax=Kribbella steppae TaxID=2512223 RepID=A0A4V2RYF7_9ACTN|nr:AlkA N-terminal domain-containing protein [Kribbella steppae]TCO19657.1 DNA-3-methyladenine glycosylase II [Kribbella steppae]